jgi:hypothetical protein
MPGLEKLTSDDDEVEVVGELRNAAHNGLFDGLLRFKLVKYQGCEASGA